MKRTQKIVATSIASLALLVNTALPAFAATTIELSGNGSNSINGATVTNTSSSVVTQVNDADVTNSVGVSADTGGNDVNNNTGGDVSVDTGNVDTKVQVANSVNTNSANVDNCNCAGDTDVLISGNGTRSENNVVLDQGGETFVTQVNVADVTNAVSVASATGDNNANNNTGGDVSVETGDAKATVKLSTDANANSARVGDDSLLGDGGSLSARIIGNGSFTDNDINLTAGSLTTITQTNSADITNAVGIASDTGGNDANNNTGGDASVDTGNVDVDVTVDNMTNFNFADAGCGCLMDVLAKIADNGTSSENAIGAEIGDELFATQVNGGEGVDNVVSAASDTGDNNANNNTGDPDGLDDPSAETGDANADIDISNSGNVNSFGGEGLDFDLPGGFVFNLNFSLSLDQLMGLLGL